jgi:hypothetical protein
MPAASSAGNSEAASKKNAPSLPTIGSICSRTDRKSDELTPGRNSVLEARRRDLVDGTAGVPQRRSRCSTNVSSELIGEAQARPAASASINEEG